MITQEFTLIYRKVVGSTDKTWSITVRSSELVLPDKVCEVEWRTSWGKTGQNQKTSRWHYAGWYSDGTLVPEVAKLIETKLKSGYVLQKTPQLVNTVKEDRSYLDIL